MKKVLVTGGAGFIGSHLVERLVKENYDVTVVDNLSTGDVSNLKNCINEIRFLEFDLNNYEKTSAALEGIDTVFHLAAIPSVQQSIDQPIVVNSSIVNSTVVLFEAISKNKSVKRVVQSVSSAAYGDSDQQFKTEDAKPEPLSPYAVAKLTQEYYGSVFADVYDIDVVSLRYFNIFGPRQDEASPYSAVIAKFVSRILTGKKPIIFGDGKNTRDFVFVEDVVRANITAGTSEQKFKGDIFNVGRGVGTSLNDLVEIINKILGTNVEAEHDAPKKGDIIHSVANVDKINNQLNFFAKVDLYEGIEQLIDFCKQQKN